MSVPMPPLEIAILDVGHGNCSIVYDGQAHMIVDVAQELTALADLQQMQCTDIGNLVLSHADADHIRGAAALLAHPDIRVGNLWVNPDPTKISELFLDLMYAAQDYHSEGRLGVFTNLNVGANPSLSAGRVGVEIVHPGIAYAISGQSNAKRPQGSISSNGMSAVLRVSLDGERAVLLPGDLDDKGLTAILDSGRDISAPVLVFPHHGGRSGASDEAEFARRLCMAVRPRLVIFSHGRNVFRNPRVDIVAGIASSGVEVQLVCTQLSKACHALEERLIPGHLLNRPAKGKPSGSCCAGSIVIRLIDGEIVWEPSIDGHSKFVDLIESPLCRRMMSEK